MRAISPALQAHLDGSATTTTALIRFDPVVPGVPSFGATLLNRDVVYDDGGGELTYRASIGMVLSKIAASAGMDVDNAESEHLLPEFDLDVTEAAIAAGAFDFAWFTVMLVNYQDLSMGHLIMPSGHGQIGQVRMVDGLSWVPELNGLTKLLKQTLVEKDSLTCRAIFGSQPIGTFGAEQTQRFPCGKDTSALWVDGTVSAVGLETNRSFTAGALGAAADVHVPGMLKWTTGSNAGRTYEVESQTAGGLIGLTFETMFPIEIGDTFEIRPDCTKWKEGNNGCKFHFGSTWVLHYRGEPLIPVADADQINAPGASLPDVPWYTTTLVGDA